jgi:hypothetical protein
MAIPRERKFTRFFNSKQIPFFITTKNLYIKKQRKTGNPVFINKHEKPDKPNKVEKLKKPDKAEKPDNRIKPRNVGFIYLSDNAMNPTLFF